VVAPEWCSERSLHLNGLRMASGRDGDAHVLTLSGELDRSTVAPIERELIDIEASGCSRIVLDLRSLSFLDSTGLHLLTRAHARSVAGGRRIDVRHASGPVRRVLEVSGVLDILTPGEVTVGA
jgi:anti-anti-sigma factor